MPFYVYSTATNSGTYVEYEENSPHDISIPKRWPDGSPMRVTIKGGHGVADKHLVTPKGVVTKVSDQEMEMLLRNPAFIRHMDKGFMCYDKKNVEPFKKAANMATKDGSAPLTPADYVRSKSSEGNDHMYTPKSSIAFKPE